MRKLPGSVLGWMLSSAACAAAGAPGPAPPVSPAPPPSMHALRAEIASRLRALIAPDGRFAGPRYQSALRARAALLRQQAASPPAPAIINWTEIGPGNVGGRINAIWLDPNNSQHLLVGSASGGLWQSNDGGSSWSDVGEFPGSLAIGALAELPNGTLLAGTGDLFTFIDSTGGGGIGDGLFSSSDGGVTWTALAATAPQTAGLFWVFINSLSVSSSGVVLAATGYPGGTGGIARSTDGGATWSTVYSGFSMDVAFDPNNPSTAVADNESGGVEFSIDGGQTWAAGVGLPGTGDRVSLAFDPSVAGSVYALVNENGETSPSGEVYHSSDGGATWSLLAGTAAFVNFDGTANGALCDDSECQGDYDNVITVEPHANASPPTILVGGIDLYASTDGGSSWTETGSWVNTNSDYLHADQHAFDYDASTGTLYVGNDGGFYKQLTSSTWQAMNAGLADTQFYGVSGFKRATSSLNAVNGIPVTPIVGGAQDNGTLLYEGYASGAAPAPDDWIPIFGGDGGMTLVDPNDGNAVYGEYVYLQAFYSTNGGPNAQYFASEPSCGGSGGCNFISPILLVPSGGAPATDMLAGAAELWLGSGIQSGNPTWTALGLGQMPASSTVVSAIATDPNDGNDVWVGYDDGELWNSGTALSDQPVWAASGSGALPTSRPVTGIWVVPGQPNVVYVTFGDYAASGTGGNVWVTVDGGTTWYDIGAGLPPGPVYSLITHPAYPQILYAGTLSGIYSSVNDGQSWYASGLGPADVEVQQLTWFDTSNPDTPTLLAATFGRGAWLGSPAYNPTPTLGAVSPAAITVGAPATAVTLTGTGFVNGVTTVTQDGGPFGFTYVSPTQLQIGLAATELAAVGIHTFVVSNPIPGGGASAGADLTVGYPVPVLASISPSSVLAGAAATMLTVTGSDFEPGSTIDWDGSPLPTTYGSSMTLTATVPASDLASAGSVQVTVRTASPGGGASGPASFVIDARGGGGALDGVSLILLLGATVWALRRRLPGSARRQR